MTKQLELPLADRGEAPKGKRSEEEPRAARGNERSGASDLMEKASERRNLQAALKRVRKNKGGPGIDGMTVDDLAAHLREHWPRLREQLLAGTYQPAPVKQQEIPKAGGGVRKLGQGSRGFYSGPYADWRGSLRVSEIIALLVGPADALTMKSILSASLVALVSMIHLAGCGGSSPGAGAACSNVTPCGGAVVGTWSITSSCLSATAAGASSSCPGATVSASKLKITGSVTYNADMTFTATSAVSGSESVTFPASCLTVNGTTFTCAQITQILTGSGVYSSVSCPSAGGGCACDLVLSPQTGTDMGTFTTTAGGLLTETSADGSVNASDYCVKGNTLTVSNHDSGSGMMGQAVTGTITATKQ